MWINSVSGSIHLPAGLGWRECWWRWRRRRRWRDSRRRCCGRRHPRVVVATAVVEALTARVAHAAHPARTRCRAPGVARAVVAIAVAFPPAARRVGDADGVEECVGAVEVAKAAPRVVRPSVAVAAREVELRDGGRRCRRVRERRRGRGRGRRRRRRRRRQRWWRARRRRRWRRLTAHIARICRRAIGSGELRAQVC